MTTDTEDTGEQPNVDIGNLDDFSDDFFNKSKKEAKAPAKEVEEAKEEVEEESAESEEVDDLATEEEEDEPEEAEEEGDELEEEPEPEPKPKKRHSAQERINELTAKARQSEREVEALRREMETLKAGREKEEPVPLRAQLPADAPDPDAVDDKGEPIYPLGEFDKNYIRDLTKFTIETESKAARERAAQEEWNEGVRLAQEELATNWATKVEEAEAEIPTIREDIVRLTEVFDKINPDYGEYLAMTIMQSEVGPEIMEYFSQNIGEAQKIVASGPAAATLAIGRLDARLSKPSTKPESQKQQKKVSNAPKPPEGSTRGTQGRTTTKPDTDNLDAFSELFYDKKRK